MKKILIILSVIVLALLVVFYFAAKKKKEQTQAAPGRPTPGRGDVLSQLTSLPNFSGGINPSFNPVLSAEQMAALATSISSNNMGKGGFTTANYGALQGKG